MRGYDPQWAGYGNAFGLNQAVDGKARELSGFFQIRGYGDKVYAAFGGAFGGGVTPGALLELNANTLALERTVALPFQGYALALTPDGSRAVVSHTRNPSFSIVDLASGLVQCVNPLRTAGDGEFRNRYVTMDPQGNSYVSYWGGKETRGVIAKFGPDGKPAKNFTPQVTESGMSFSVLYRDGKVYTGAKSLLAVSSSDGSVQQVLPKHSEWNIYTYASGPGNTLFAINYKYEGYPNLLQIDPMHNGVNGILTGRGSLEATYLAKSRQAFVSNFVSKTVSVAALDTQGRLIPGAFVNIAFEGEPLGVYARHTAQGAQVFVTTQYRGNDNNAKAGLLHKIQLSNEVVGIENIEKVGACTIQTFNLADQSVSKPQACRILNAKASYAAVSDEMKSIVSGIEQELATDTVKLQQTIIKLEQVRKDNGTEHIVALEKQLSEQHKAIESSKNSLVEATADWTMFKRLAEQ